MRERQQSSSVSKRPRPPSKAAAPPEVSVKRSRSADDAYFRQTAFPDDPPAHSAGPSLYCSDSGPRGPGIAWASRCDVRFGSQQDGPGRGGWWGWGHAGCDSESGLAQYEPGSVGQRPGKGQDNGPWRELGAGSRAGERWCVGARDGAWGTAQQWHGHGGGMLRDERMQV